MNKMIPLNLSEIKRALDEEGYATEWQSATDQLYFSLKGKDRLYPTFAKILNKSAVLQLIAFFTIKVKESAVGDLARLLHLLNKELDLPGFGFDEKAQAVFFRVVLPSEEEKISLFHLKSYLKSFLTVLAAFGQAVEAVAAGLLSFEEMMKRAEEEQKKGSVVLIAQNGERCKKLSSFVFLPLSTSTDGFFVGGKDRKTKKLRLTENSP